MAVGPAVPSAGPGPTTPGEVFTFGGGTGGLSRPTGVESGNIPCSHGLDLISPTIPAATRASATIWIADCTETKTVGCVPGMARICSAPTTFVS